MSLSAEAFSARRGDIQRAAPFECPSLPAHLGDALAYLIAHRDGIVNHVSPAQLEALQQPAAHGPLEENVPLYSFVKVYLESSWLPENTPVYLGFVNNGLLPFADGEGLGRYCLDVVDYYHAVQHLDGEWVETPIPDVFLSAGMQVRDYRFFFPTIMEDFFLDGSGDWAGFVGLFLVIEE